MKGVRTSFPSLDTLSEDSKHAFERRPPTGRSFSRKKKKETYKNNEKKKKKKREWEKMN